MIRKDMRPYDQTLFDNIVKGDFEKVAFRLMPQIEAMLFYSKSQYCRKSMQEEIVNLAEIIKAGNLEWRKQVDARWEATR